MQCVVFQDRLANSQKQLDRRSSVATPEEIQKTVPSVPNGPSAAALVNRRHTIDAGASPPPPPPPVSILGYK